MYSGGLLRVLLSFSSSFSLIFLHYGGNIVGTRKRITFWIERLIVNSTGELSLMETQFHTDDLLLLLLSHFSRVRLCATPETAAHQAPPSLGFSRQEHWSGLPLPSPMHESEVAQSCPTLRDPMDYSLPGSSVRWP